MIPRDLEKRLDKLAHFFGGYDAVKNIASEDRLIEIALFNGPVATISPFSQLWSVEEPIQPIHTLNLETIGYRSGKYTVFNKDKLLLYAALPKKRNNAWVYGLDERDIRLAQRGKHGEHFYLLVETYKGPQLAILWLCKELPAWAIERKLIEWEDQRDKLRAGLQYNELTIDLSSLTGKGYIAVTPGSIGEQLSAEQIIYRVNELGEGYIVELDVSQPAYLRISSDSWFAMWGEEEFIDYLVEIKDFTGTGRERVYSLKDSYFLKGSRLNGSWLFSAGSAGSRPVMSNAFEPLYIQLVSKAYKSNQTPAWL